MKQTSYITIVLGMLLLTGCQQEENLSVTGGQGKELRIAASVKGMTEATTRMLGNDFFTPGNEIEMKITNSTTGAVAKTYTYVYTKEGVFRGKNAKDAYRFTLDDTYIQKLDAHWPTTAIRGKGLQTDQRKLEDFRKADWLAEATGQVANIIATDAPVPLTFKHQNSRLVFEIAGQNAHGTDIEELILELQYGKPTAKATAFWAYCGNEDGTAELILNDSVSVKCEANYMVGRVKLKDYTGTIFFPKIEFDLKSGYSYLVTLTPRGDNYIASIHFGGFGQDEEGIGVPFQQPALQPDGSYAIQNAPQLVTLSYLIRNYTGVKDPNQNVDGIDWRVQKYLITTDITMGNEWTGWHPIPSTLLPRAQVTGIEKVTFTNSWSTLFTN